jgi:hypothetical protein
MNAKLQQVTKKSESFAERVRRPLQEFAAAEASGGIVLLLCIVAALLWANLPLASSYTGFWETKLGLSLGRFELSDSLLHWINDGLMAIFFFYIGLEIKREILVGELSSPRHAAPSGNLHPLQCWKACCLWLGHSHGDRYCLLVRRPGAAESLCLAFGEGVSDCTGDCR